MNPIDEDEFNIERKDTHKFHVDNFTTDPNIRITGNFNIHEPEIKNLPEIENSNEKIGKAQILKEFVIYKLPLIALIIYVSLIHNYATLAYFMLCLCFINLEFENFYRKNPQKNSLQSPLHENTSGYYILNIKFWLYVLLSIITTILFILKVLFCFLSIFDPVFLANIHVSYDFLKNFDFYLTIKHDVSDILKMFLPNFFIMIISITLALKTRLSNKRKEITWSLDLEEEFKILDIMNFMIMVCFLVIPAFDFDLTGICFLFFNLVVLLFLNLKRIYGLFYELLYYFYHFIKIIIIIIFFLNYFALIQVHHNNIPIANGGFFDYDFLGINTFYNIDSVDVIFF